MSTVVIEDLKPIIKNTLRAFCRSRFPSGMIMADIAIHVSDGHAWASPPAIRMIDRSGAPMLDSNGKQRWQPIITFSSKAVRDAWSKAVLEGVQNQYPDVLADAQVESVA